MARGPVAIQDGFLYQAYYFWLKAVRLFKIQSKVSRVGYEIASQKSFDDVYVEYSNPRRCPRGGAIERDLFQLKYHVDHSGDIGYEDLMNPEFIGAKKISFLQRLRDLCKSNPEFAKRSTFQLYTPWGVRTIDPLSELVTNGEGEIRLVKLKTGGPNSKFGKVRTAWREHLGLTTDDELFEILHPLRIRRGDDMEKLRERLNEQLESLGLKPIDPGKSSDEYPALIQRLSKEGKEKFTRDELFAELQRDGLVISSPPATPHSKQFAIRSFFREYDFLEDVSEQYLSLESLYFDGRAVLDPAMWNAEIKSEVVKFASTNFTSKNSPMDLHLDVHSSLAVAIGSLVNLKAQVDIAPVQKFRGKDLVWRVSDQPYQAPKLKSETHKCGTGPEIAVAVNITRNTTEDVKQYIANSLPNVGDLIVFEPDGGPNQSAIKDADHAWSIAEQLSEQLRSARTKLGVGTPIHFFNSSPNSVLFFMGRMCDPVGAIQLYEFDFEKKRHGTYEPSITLPWK